MKIALLFVGLIGGVCFALKAQQYRATSFSIENGLTQSQVKALLQDSRGHIWMGTAGGGLSRFDGHEFKTFGIDEGLASGDVSSIALDKQGRIWTVCNGGGISIYDGFKFKTIGKREGLEFDIGGKLIGSSDGSMWLGTFGDGLFQIGDGKVRHFTRKDGLPNDTVLSLVELPSGRILIGTLRGLAQWESGQIKPLSPDLFKQQPKGNVSSMTLLRNGNVIGGGFDLVWKLVGFEFVYDTLTPSNQIGAIGDILEDSEGQIWLAGDNLAARGAFGNFVRQDGKPGFKPGEIQCFIEDENRNVWMGTDYSGAIKFSLEAFSNYGAGTPFIDLAVFGLIENGPGLMWAGTEKGLFELRDGIVSEVKDFPSPEAFVYELEHNEKGEIVIITDDESYLYKENSFVRIKGDKSFHRRVRSTITKTRKGEVLLSNANGIYRLQGDSAITMHFPGLDSIRGAYFFSESKTGEIYFATSYDGAFKLEGDHLKHFGLEDGLPSERILEVARDHNDVLWLATYEGLARVKNDKICYFSHREGMLGSLVYLILFDQNGDLWAGTSNGLSRIQLDQNSEPISIRNYGAAEGFTGIECNQNSRAVDSKGRLWFGNIGGLTVYDRSRDIRDSVAPKIMIEKVLIDMEEPNWRSRKNELKPWSQTPIDPILGADESNIRIEFAGITNNSPEKVKYRFMLEGHSDEFGPYTTDRHATYTLLPPGKYTFKVHAVNAAGVETKVPASFSFTITAPWYKTIWFGFALLGLLVFSVIGIIQLRTRNFQRQRLILEQKVKHRTEALEMASKVKSEFLANMSHEIRTPMNGVIGMTDLLQRTPLSAQQRRFVDNIRLSGENLLTLINDILDFSRIESGKMELEELPFELRHSMEEVLDTMAFSAFSKGLELLYWVDPEIRGPIVGDATRLKQILVNLVGNAIKFTSKGEVIVKARLKEIVNGKAVIELMVKDSGIGIPKAKHDSLFESFTQVDASTTRKYGGTGLGLAISYNLSKIMGGDMWLVSDEGEGSEFYITIVGGLSAPWKFEGEAHPANAIEGKKVVVATQNTASASLISDYLGHWKVDYKLFEELESAIDLAIDDTETDMIFVDLRLVHGDPKGFATKFRGICENRKLSFALFAEPDIALMLQGLVGEKGWVLSKPLKRDELLMALSQNRSSGSDLVFSEEIELVSNRIPLNILVAEDNPINQDVAVGMLASLGYDCKVAVNGKEALDAALKGGLDLIFMDVQMPVMDGLEATRQIVAQIPIEKRPLIIAMTANAMQSDRENCLRAGMDTFISKPFLMEELRRVLASVPAMRAEDKAGTKQSSLPPIEEHSPPLVDPKAVKSKIDASGNHNGITSLSMLEEVSGGDPTFMKGILSKMLVKLPEAIDELKAANEIEDWETVRATAHRSKSSAAYTGAEILRTQFMELEYCARDKQELAEIPGRIEALDKLVQQVLAEIQIHLSRF